MYSMAARNCARPAGVNLTRTGSALRQDLVSLGENTVEIEAATSGDFALAFGQQVQNLPFVLSVFERLDAHENGCGTASLCDDDRLARSTCPLQRGSRALAQFGDRDDVGNSSHSPALHKYV
jgi:hypothetical protein